MNIFGSNSNYPPGVNDNTPGAPWNEPDCNMPIDVDVLVSMTLSKNTTIETADYIAESWDDYETDDEGGRVHIGGTEYDFSECNLEKDYKNCEWSIPDLLSLLESYLLKDLKANEGNKAKVSTIKNQLESLRGWTVDELEVIKE